MVKCTKIGKLKNGRLTTLCYSNGELVNCSVCDCKECVNYAGCIDLRGKQITSITDVWGNELNLSLPANTNDLITQLEFNYNVKATYVNFGANLCNNSNLYELQITGDLVLGSITYTGTGTDITQNFYQKGECPEVDLEHIIPSCWYDQFIEGGLDNTGTSFRHTNQVYTVYLSDGSVCTFSIAGANNWTDQVNKISNGLGGCLDAVESVPYCTNGCGGLPSPFIELDKMLWRYSGFKICPGKPYPIKVTYTSDQLETPRDLVLQTILSEKIYLDRCKTCDTVQKWFALTGESYEPICPKPCSESEFSIQESVCSFTLVNACDNGTNPATAILIQYADCGDGSLVNDIFSLDADGGLEEYTPIGEIDDCNGNIVVEPSLESKCCPVIREYCACIDGILTTIQYGIYPDTGEHVGWYSDVSTGEFLKRPITVNCCSDCKEE